MNYFRKIFRYAKPYRLYAVLNIVSNVFYALFGSLAFIALIPMLDVLFKKDLAPVTVKPVYEGMGTLQSYYQQYLSYQVHHYAQDDTSKALLLVIGLVIVLFLLKNFFGYLANYFITFLRNGVLKDLRNDLYKKMVGLPISYYSEKRKGDSIARISTDVLEIQHSFLSILELIVREPLTILFSIILMVIISAKLTVFVFIFIPVSGFIISRIGKSLKRRSSRVQQEQGHFLSILEETLGGLKIIKGFNAEKLFNDKFKDSTSRFFRFSNGLMHRQNLATPISEFLGIVVIAILLWYGGQMVLSDASLDGSSFIAYMGLAYNILTPAKAISKASYGVKKGNAAAERVLEILETDPQIKDPENAFEKEGFDGEIQIKNISFKYEHDWVLKDFSLKIPKGSTVALVGQSGSGKSTIANLLTRFYDVNEGRIEIDGKGIKELSLKSLRGLMGLVTQDSILFNDTVKGNLLVAKPSATDEEIIEALKVANAWEFVKNLEAGIHTNIGDGGGKLSGGQKQRISIARAVLKNPPIMILDEATSALDTESERLVQDALENMMKNRTSIVIAHRLSTVQNADIIVVLSKGQIVEQGKHRELLEKRGTYFNLVEMQTL
ncbi:MAG TPA: ABC transporter ATP-binding protein [Flavobacteriaceae bacterium]|nr:ABC transporter ATP-binding protein [Flavobacteriaceae bacterium]MCB9213778.1 ABC transporter ATP-binding protein [Alteromonas sp.]HPF11305.1 ABC transporter ATP-binding protein [Flavobacteriaceae bacterium]HQU22203.1 ABC transporter ATP-binding protein [Flavobacteriaceae bacterium]HQU64476.1 ABC transporter ATP-binding protein [Flavobacteriaceae bacterium]